MSKIQWIIAFVLVMVLSVMGDVGLAKTLSREEVDALWEELLQNERYEMITFSSRSPTPIIYKFNEEKRLGVDGANQGYLWGLLWGDLSDGGGWEIEGRLEAEISIDRGILQLYSKSTIKWSPSFAFFWMPSYNPQKYPVWEFHLILRDPVRRQEIQTIKAVPVPPQEVLQQPQFRFNPDDPSCPLGQRCPRGELHYNSIEKMATIRISGVLNPFSVEVPIPGFSFEESMSDEVHD